MPETPKKKPSPKKKKEKKPDVEEYVAAEEEVVVETETTSPPETKKDRHHTMLIVGILVGFMSVIGVGLIVMGLGYDARIFPSSLEGTISNKQSDPVINAQVCAQEKCTTTNDSGEFILNSLVYGEASIEINAEFYNDTTTTITLNRGENNKNFTVESSGVGDLTGTIESSNNNLLTEDLSITLGNEEVLLSDTGEFNLKNYPAGEYKLSINSPNYINQEISVGVKEGKNVSDPVVLEPAVNIEFKVRNWLTKQFISNAGITEEVTEENYTSTDNGTVVIENLPLDEDIKLTVNKEGYLTKVIKPNDLVQGFNELKIQTLIPEGKIVYTSSRTGDTNIFASNYDGSDEDQVTNTGGIRSYYYNQTADKVYFGSTHEQVQKDGQTQTLYYSINLDGSSLVQLSPNSYGYQPIANESIDLQSLTRTATIVTGLDDDPPYNTSLFVDGLDKSTLTSSFFDVKGAYYSPYIFSDDGNHLVVNLSDFNSSFPKENGDRSYGYWRSSWELGAYYLNTNNSQIKFIEPRRDSDGNYRSYRFFDFSSGNSRILYSTYNQDTNTEDLWVRDIVSNSASQLTTTSTSEFSAKFSPNDEHISFLSSRDNVNLYIIEANGSNEKLIAENVSSYDWINDDLIRFTNAEGLYIVDISKQRNQKLVTKDTNSNHNYYYYY